MRVFTAHDREDLTPIALRWHAFPVVTGTPSVYLSDPASNHSVTRGTGPVSHRFHTIKEHESPRGSMTSALSGLLAAPPVKAADPAGLKGTPAGSISKSRSGHHRVSS
jgi:hypothetical protein